MPALPLYQFTFPITALGVVELSKVICELNKYDELINKTIFRDTNLLHKCPELAVNFQIIAKSTELF